MVRAQELVRDKLKQFNLKYAWLAKHMSTPEDSIPGPTLKDWLFRQHMNLKQTQKAGKKAKIHI